MFFFKKTPIKHSYLLQSIRSTVEPDRHNNLFVFSVRIPTRADVSEPVKMSLKFLLFVLLTVPVLSCLACRKVPPVKNAGQKTRGDNNYRILIGDDPQGYEPGKTYNLFLLGSRTHTRVQQFTHFMLTAKSATTSDRATARYSPVSPKVSGRFQLFGDSLATFKEDCVNTVSEADDFPKTEIQVMWVAPQKGSGCIALSAMVYEGRNSWYSDDGALTKVICEAKPNRESLKTECCACDEAKYQVIWKIRLNG